MNKYYLIVPAVLLAGFVGIERRFERQRAEEETARTAAARAAKIEEDRIRTERQAAAATELQQKNAERERQERERQEKKRLGLETALAHLQQQTATHETEAAKLAVDLERMATELGELRKKRTEVDDEAFTLSREVTLQRVERRNAELELQRTTAMIALRLQESAWSNPTPAKPPTATR